MLQSIGHKTLHYKHNRLSESSTYTVAILIILGLPSSVAFEQHTFTKEHVAAVLCASLHPHFKG